MLVAKIANNDAIKNSLWKKFCYLCKNILALIHEMTFSRIKHFKSTRNKKLLQHRFYKGFKERILIYSGH